MRKTVVDLWLFLGDARQMYYALAQTIGPDGSAMLNCGLPRDPACIQNVVRQ